MGIQNFLREEKEEVSSRPLIGIEDDGQLYIDAGQSGNLVTQLGSDESKFRPYLEKINENIYLFTYLYNKEFIPANFKSVDDFLEVLNSQSSSNQYIENYLRLSVERMSAYLEKMKLISDDTTFVVINNGSDILAKYVELWKEKFDNIYDDIIFVKPEINEDELYISPNAPEDINNYLSDILEELQKVDAHLTLDEVDIDTNLYVYLRGFVDVYPENLENISGNIILLSDFYSNAFLSLETKEHIEKIVNYEPRLSVMIGKKQ